MSAHFILLSSFLKSQLLYCIVIIVFVHVSVSPSFLNCVKLFDLCASRYKYIITQYKINKLCNSIVDIGQICWVFACSGSLPYYVARRWLCMLRSTTHCKDSLQITLMFCYIFCSEFIEVHVCQSSSK